MAKLKKSIVYTIEAQLKFGAEEDIEISEILVTLREYGSAEVTDVKVVDEVKVGMNK